MSAASAYVVRGLFRFCAQQVVAALPLLRAGHRDVRLSGTAATADNAPMIAMHTRLAVLDRADVCSNSSVGHRKCVLELRQSGSGWQARSWGLQVSGQGVIPGCCACVYPGATLVTALGVCCLRF